MPESNRKRELRRAIGGRKKYARSGENVRVRFDVDSAEHLFRIACDYDFTLYEFFQTDVAWYSMDYARACAVLRVYDRFIADVTPAVLSAFTAENTFPL